MVMPTIEPTSKFAATALILPIILWTPRYCLACRVRFVRPLCRQHLEMLRNTSIKHADAHHESKHRHVDCRVMS